MMCEMCGGEKLHLYKAIVEGSILSVCERCKKFGEVISIEKPKIEEHKQEKQKPKAKPEEEKQEIIVDDYSWKIRKAREEKEMTQEELAKALAEKESMIHKIESNQMTPSLQLAKKLEQFLRINLIEEFDPNKAPAKELDFKDEAITIGDLIRLKKK
ncbi:MAG: multiprotein bridging factor aMBF1 [Nanoarchaeota archaeon]|nr:multiprotein bridging factor aMBF1 [Nanoarchaeota archaeon]